METEIPVESANHLFDHKTTYTSIYGVLDMDVRNLKKAKRKRRKEPEEDQKEAGGRTTRQTGGRYTLSIAWNTH